MLTMPHHSSPQAPDAGARSVLLRFHCHPGSGEGYLYRRLRTPLARRTLRWNTGSRVPGYVLQYRREACDIAVTTATCTASCRTLTEWLSGSGGTGETRLNELRLCWQAASAKKRHSRCPLHPINIARRSFFPKGHYSCPEKPVFGGLLLKILWL